MLDQLRHLRPLLLRGFPPSRVRSVHKVSITEKEKETIFRGQPVESDRIPALVTTEDHSQACPLCRLNLRSLKYTDVLILSQFMDSEGHVLPLEQTKLCGKKYFLVSQLIRNAQRCRLLPRPADYPVFPKWDEFNTYHDWPPRYRDQPMHLIQEDFWR